MNNQDINQVTPYDVVAEGFITLLHSCLQLDASLAESIPE